jgi:hypothetical protein
MSQFELSDHLLTFVPGPMEAWQCFSLRLLMPRAVDAALPLICRVLEKIPLLSQSISTAGP